MIVLQTAAIVAVGVFVFGLPGALLGRLLVPRAAPHERLVLTGAAGFSVLPLGLYLVATFADRPITPGFVLVAAAAANASLGAVLLRRGGDVERPDTRALAATAAMLVAFGVLLAGSVQPIGGVDVFATIHHCMYVMVLYAIGNDPSVGIPLYDGVDRTVLSLLAHHPHEPLGGLGGLFGEQRPGNVALLAPHVSLFGTVGWLTAPVLASTVGAAACYAAARELGARPAVAAVCVGAGMLGVHSFLGYVINENLFGFALLAVLTWLLVRRDLSPGMLVLAGLLMAHVVGVRYTACLFWPALAWRFATVEAVGRPARRAALWAVPAGVLSVPWLALNVGLLGTPFAHPAGALDLDASVVENLLPGTDAVFRFKALNYPFAEALVRAPWNPFPNALMVPLRTAQELGAPLLALGLGGLVLHAAGDRRRALALLAFAAPHLLAIAWLENLNRAQLTYVVLGLAPLLAWAAGGAEAAVARPRDRATWAALGGAAVLVVGGGFVARAVDVPPDERLAGDGAAIGPDPGLARELTTPRLLPALAPLRTDRLAATAAAIRHHRWRRGDGRYRSGEVAITVPVGRAEPTTWSFTLTGRPHRREGDPVRTSQGLQTVTLALPVAEVEVRVRGARGEYEVAVDPVGPEGEVHDFTFFVHGWSQPTHAVAVRWKGLPLPDVRFEQTESEHEWRTGVTTNVPPRLLGLVDVPFTVDLGGLEADCGYFTFVGRGGGGHRHPWTGARSGTIPLPPALRTDRVVFLPDPYCRPGPPQPGARYAEAAGPFGPGRPIRLRVDRAFGLRGGGWLEFHDPPGR